MSRAIKYFSVSSFRNNGSGCVENKKYSHQQFMPLQTFRTEHSWTILNMLSKHCIKVFE